MWVAIGLIILVVIAVVLVFVMNRRRKKDQEFNQALYSQTPFADPILEEKQKDIEKDMSGKGNQRVDHFEDHADIMRQTTTTAVPDDHIQTF